MDTLILPGVALLINLLIVIIFYSKSRAHNAETKIYSKILIVNLIDTIITIAGYIYAKKVGQVSGIIYFQKIYMSLMLLISVYIIKYNFAIMKLKETTKTYFDYFLTVTYGILFIVILLTPLNVINYANVLDGYGLSYDIVLVATIIYLIFIVATSFYNFRTNIYNLKKVIPFICLIFFYILGFVGRHYFPNIMFENFFFSYMLLIMYFTIENPDVKMIEQLNIANANALRANQAKSEFLSSMSHEIRTPLNAIVGLASQINENKDCPSSMKEDLNDILVSSNTLLEIVGNIIDINKIETSKLVIVNVPYSLRTEINTIIKINKLKLENKDITLNINIEDGVPDNLIGDKNHLKQILNNLLSNAIKYTNNGSISIDISSTNDNNIANLTIKVSDTGIGIRKENLEKLFTKFERLDTEINSNIEGTGLGLVITKKLVELMNGTIEVSSKYNVGSTFLVKLPQKMSSTPSTLEKSNIIKDSSKKILLVDDNKLNIKVAKRLLNSLGYDNIVECYNGEECLEKVKNDTFDIILMDIMMPIMDGPTALKNLQSLPNFNTPVVAITADALATSKEHYLSLGFNDYLSKPYTKEQLQDKLAKYI
ncbi:MAG: ATP-binding protein [Bacilli bacterium]